ncbi:hypothetical protein GlitD10_1812 [Gloeomargarita lithophora Alchichica-D10]|uniref:DUF4350 domain-containing protein n=1 Tax=Gloeomargarita lithophora Alchichica-D10 TaxID=1188229 RepID=A0A1J0ADX3_9CYAN|nr:DUF4350 domain-containing protein [Gloeomargarita lithophora]APB34138.1 hypothetical protein GlitD10_1812 [Gloeomargarita lithophora Alchichica-D10]
MRKNNRWWVIGLIILVVASGLIFLFAPAGNDLKRGSTYSRSPDGYGAWYEFMQAQGHAIERWQKPAEQLNNLEKKITLLRVGSDLSPYGHGYTDPDWLASGNVLIELGIETPVTGAPFTTRHPTELGDVKIQTRRRFPEITTNPSPPSEVDEMLPLLDDDYGIIVRQKKIEDGQHIEIITSHLAANAYQAETGNFNYLKSLVTQPELPIYVDEFMHGYKDEETRQKEGNRNWIDYLSRTPWRAVLIQGIIIMVILLWGLNWRLGSPAFLKTPEVDNSRVYMDALSAVLMRAGCTELVIELLRQEEQRYLQKQLGFGDELLALEQFAAIWEQQTGQKATELMDILGLTPQRLSDRELTHWLEKLQTLRTKVQMGMV